MAKLQVMVPVELAQETEELQPEDELLTSEELATISLFTSVKKAPPFKKFPGTTVLRRGRPGRVLFTPGQPGSTAFYILSTEDVLRLREQQLQAATAIVNARSEGQSELPKHQFFSQLSDRELERRQQSLTQEVEELRRRVDTLQSADEDEAQQMRRVATASLSVSLDEAPPKKGLFHRIVRSLRRSQAAGEYDVTTMIPIDAPTDIDARTLQAPLFESEIFGEMSCMNRMPRSATVTIDEDCYLLEMLRNVLDMLQRDPTFRKQMDDEYRKRVMETQIRRLPIFRDLTEKEYAKLHDSVRLEVFEAGTVIFEEHDPSTDIYVIRSGLVKVIKNTGCRIREDEMTDVRWKALCAELADAGANQPESAGEAEIGRLVWDLLPPDIQTALIELPKGTAPAPEQRKQLLSALNDVISKGELHLSKQFGKTTQDILDAVLDVQLQATFSAFPEKTKNWSELERRIFHRVFLESLFPNGMPKRMATCGPMKTLAYLGRGDILGEMGVLRNVPRSATCVAYDHPEGYHQRIPDSRTGLRPARVEVIRIPQEPFAEVLESSQRLRSRVEQVMQVRIDRSQRRRKMADERPTLSRNQTVEFEELGLIQGTQLMLIDLDRCTRCNACVEACVSAHDDGRTRLYLDGPRLENYLVPLTCRSCRDPVCMIGCPVGAINRGNNGEIRIRDWCIGCKLCAEQCPYGAIQMDEVRSIQLSSSQQDVLDSSVTIKPVTHKAFVCDLCSSLSSRDPACVYACPHDAAIRVDAQDFFFQE